MTGKNTAVLPLEESFSCYLPHAGQAGTIDVSVRYGNSSCRTFLLSYYLSLVLCPVNRREAGTSDARFDCIPLYRSFACVTSNRLRIDSVVLLVRSDEPDIHNSIGVVDPYDNPIFVPSNVKNGAAVLKNALIMGLHSAQWLNDGLSLHHL